MKLEDFLDKDMPKVKVRKGAHEKVRMTKRHEDPRRKTRAKQKREWKREVSDYS